MFSFDCKDGKFIALVALLAEYESKLLASVNEFPEEMKRATVDLVDFMLERRVSSSFP